MDHPKLTIENNTCIISSYLIDELDYVVGGYGEPSVESIFNLNAFIEAYILSSHFIITRQEFDHIRITSKLFFPQGRPILDLLTKSEKQYFVDGLGNPLSLCVFVEKTTERDNQTIENAIARFVQRDADRIKRSFVLSNLANPIEEVKTFNVGFQETQIIIGETSNKPFEIVKSFYDTITNYNVQSALPIFTYKQQFNELRKKAISKEIFKTICDIQGQQVEDAEQYLGGEIQALPPLVNIVFSKAKSREDIPNTISEVREDFTEFRDCCENFEKSLSEAKTIKEQLDLIKQYKTFWATLVKKYTDKTSRILFRFIDMAKESDYEKSMDTMIDTQSASEVLKELNLGKVAGKAGLLAWDKIKEKRILNKFKGVVNLWSLLESAPSIDYQIKNVERIFKVPIDRQRVQIARKYLKEIEKTSAKKVLPTQIGETN